MTLEGGFTLQRSFPRRVAGGNTLVRGDLGWQVDEKEGGAAVGADLGGSSKYSNENFEGRSGKGFHENSNWSWVTRS